MLWIKSFHIIALIAWFAGLFYLPRLFVYHTEIPASDETSYTRFCTMEKRLFWGIMTPSAVITIMLGIGLIHSMHYSFYHLPTWLVVKIALVFCLVFYHIYCGIILNQFKNYKNTKSTLFFRVFNELAVFILVGIVLLVVLKPSF